MLFNYSLLIVPMMFFSGCTYIKETTSNFSFAHKLTPLTIVDKSSQAKKNIANLPPAPKESKHNVTISQKPEAK